MPLLLHMCPHDVPAQTGLADKGQGTVVAGVWSEVAVMLPLVLRNIALGFAPVVAAFVITCVDRLTVVCLADVPPHPGFHVGPVAAAIARTNQDGRRLLLMSGHLVIRPKVRVVGLVIASRTTATAVTMSWSINQGHRMLLMYCLQVLTYAV